MSCADLDLKTSAIFIHFSLFFHLSRSPLPFHPIPISPARPFCVRADLEVQNQNFSVVSCFSLTPLLFTGILAEDLIWICSVNRTPVSIFYIVSRLNKHKRSCVSAGAKPYYVHHPYGGGYASVAVPSLPHFYVSQDFSAAGLATIFSQSLAGCQGGDKCVAVIRR